MKIVHVCTYPGGGAGIAAQRLHQGLLDSGQDSHFFTLHSGGSIQNHHVYQHKPTLGQRLSYYLGGRKKQAEMEAVKNALLPGFDWFSTPVTPLRPENAAILQEADIIHLHWVSDFINWNTFFSELKEKTIIWTMHDQNPYTGGCHYTAGCEQYLTECRLCPQLEDGYKNQVDKLFQLKKSAIDKSKGLNLHLIGPSYWNQQAAQRSAIGNSHPVHLVPNCAPASIFKYSDYNLRKEFGLTTSDKVLIFVSDELGTKRKGFLDLLLNLEAVSSDMPLTCLLIGTPDPQTPFPPNVRFIPLGKIADPARIAAAYRTADAFVIASREDNLPNTVLESLCCGTPVIGYAVGGIGDMVQNGINGFLAPEHDRSQLGSKIQEFFTRIWDPKIISQDALKRWASSIQADAMIALYKKAMQG